MGKFKKLQEDIENVTNKEVVKQTRISGVATIVLIISVACAIGGMSFEDPEFFYADISVYRFGFVVSKWSH